MLYIYKYAYNGGKIRIGKCYDWHWKGKPALPQGWAIFPTIPDELAVRLKEKDTWVFSTREIELSPYLIKHYIDEFDLGNVEDYVVLSHSGHGVNSYAIQYYLVHGKLVMFLHLGWGGVYSDVKEDRVNIRDSFAIADKIVLVAKTSAKLRKDNRLLIVGSDFYGSYWYVSGKKEQKQDTDLSRPVEVLTEVLQWLKE